MQKQADTLIYIVEQVDHEYRKTWRWEGEWTDSQTLKLWQTVGEYSWRID